MNEDNLVIVPYNKYFIFQCNYVGNQNELRFGQAFCNEFNITDSVLFFIHDQDQAHSYIMNNYIKK